MFIIYNKSLTLNNLAKELLDEKTAQLQEISRQEKVARSALYQSIAQYRKRVHVTKVASYKGDTTVERPILPYPIFSPTLKYNGGQPSQSAFYTPKPKRQVTVTDQVTVKVADSEEDGSIDNSAAWRNISLYAPVRYMIMQGMKSRFGGDAVDPEGWVAKTEEYCISNELDIDEIYCQIKDTCQEIYKEEAAAWGDLMARARMERNGSNSWFSSYFF